MSRSVSQSQSTTVTSSISGSETASASVSQINVALPGQWRVLAQTVDSLERAAAVCNGTQLIVFGGRNDLGRVGNSMFTYSPEAGWGEISYTGEIAGLYGHQMEMLNNAFYIFGGTQANGEISDVLWRFDASRTRWVALEPSGDRPVGRTWFQMVAIPERQSLLILFGRTQKLLDPELWEYRIADNSWTIIKPFSQEKDSVPLPRFATCCKYDQTGRTVYCFGGTTPDGDVNTLWGLKIDGSGAAANFTWIRQDITNGPSPRRSAQCAIVNNTFIVTGGRDTEVTGTTVADDDLFIFFLSNRTWTVVVQPESVPPPLVGRVNFTATQTHPLTATRQVTLTGTASITRSRTPMLRRKTDTKTPTHSVTFSRSETTTATRYAHVVALRSPTATSTLHRPNTTAPSTPGPTTIAPPPPPPTPAPFTPVEPPVVIGTEDVVVTFRGSPRESGVMCTSDVGVYLQGGLRDDEVLNDLRLLGPNFHFSVLSESRPFPSKRTDHVAFMVAMRMFIAFGRDGVGPLSDIWSFNTQTEEWRQRRPTNAPRGRYGCSASVVGSIVYFFGGLLSITDSTSFTNELWQYDVAREIFKQIVSPTPPPGRAFHQAVATGGDILVLFGSTTQDLYASDGYVYNALTGTWIPVAFSGAAVAPAGRQRAGITIDPTGTVIYGGVSRRPLSDRWLIGRPTLNGTVAQVRVQQLRSDVPHGYRPRIFSRGAAAIAGTGNRAIICGGIIAEGSPPREQDSCYQYERTIGLNSPMLPGPVQTAYSTGAYFGRYFYVFGGLAAENSIIQDKGFLNTLQIYEFSTVTMCDFSNDTTYLDQKCMYCSAGTSAPDCHPTPPGSYRTLPFGPVVQCPPGTFMSSAIAGAQSLDYCSFCPTGTFADQPGSLNCSTCPSGAYCPIGSSRITQQNVSNIEAAGVDVIPPAFAPLVVPFSVWTTFGIVGGLMLIGIAIMLLLRRRNMANVVVYYITPEQNLMLRQMYREFHVAGSGLRLIDLHNVLTDPRLQLLRPLETTYVEDLFRKHDEDGSMSIGFTEFRFLLFEMIDDGYLPPFPNTMRERYGVRNDAMSRFFRKVSFKNLDKYYAEHRVGDMGDPIRLQKNANGGILTIVFYLAFLIMLVALVVTFTYDNMVEARSSMPNTLISESFRSRIEFLFSIQGSSDPNVCIQAPGVCLPGTSVTATNILATDQFITCEFIEPLQCDIKWTCIGCELSQTTAAVALQISDSRAFASEVHIESSVSTGIHELETPTSSPEMRFSVANWDIELPQGRLLKGFPGTEVEGRMTQTVFRSPRSSWNQALRLNNGYHVQSVETTTRIGQTVTEADFGNFYGIPITVQLEVAPSSLVVVRTPKQTIIQFFTGILGAMSGLSGGILSLLIMLDRRANQKQKKNVEERKKQIAASVASADGSNQGSPLTESPAGSFSVVPVDEEPTLDGDDLDDEAPRLFHIGALSPEEREMVTNLSKHDVNIFAAVEILRLSQAVARNTRGGNQKAAWGPLGSDAHGDALTTGRKADGSLDVQSADSSINSQAYFPTKKTDLLGSTTAPGATVATATSATEPPAPPPPSEAEGTKQLEDTAAADNNRSIATVQQQQSNDSVIDVGNISALRRSTTPNSKEKRLSRASSGHDIDTKNFDEVVSSARAANDAKNRIASKAEQVNRRIEARRKASEHELQKLREKKERERSRRSDSRGGAASEDDDELDTTARSSKSGDGGGEARRDSRGNRSRNQLDSSNPLLPPVYATLPDDEEHVTQA